MPAQLRAETIKGIQSAKNKLDTDEITFSSHNNSDNTVGNATWNEGTRAVV